MTHLISHLISRGDSLISIGPLLERCIPQKLRYSRKPVGFLQMIAQVLCWSPIFSFRYGTQLEMVAFKHFPLQFKARLSSWYIKQLETVSWARRCLECRWHTKCCVWLQGRSRFMMVIINIIPPTLLGASFLLGSKPMSVCSAYQPKEVLSRMLWHVCKLLSGQNHLQPSGYGDFGLKCPVYHLIRFCWMSFSCFNLKTWTRCLEECGPPHVPHG